MMPKMKRVNWMVISAYDEQPAKSFQQAIEKLPTENWGGVSVGFVICRRRSGRDWKSLFAEPIGTTPRQPLTGVSKGLLEPRSQSLGLWDSSFCLLMLFHTAISQALWMPTIINSIMDTATP